MRCSTRQFLFLILLVGLVLIYGARTTPLDSIESSFSQWLAVNSARHPVTAPLVLVQITEEDLNTNPWPWSPVDYSLFLTAALPFQPPVLAIEPVLAWKKPDPQQLSLLHDALLRAPKALLGTEFGFPDDPSMVPPFQEVPVLRHFEGSINRLREFPLIALQPNEELRLAATLGFFEPYGMPSGMVHRVPLVFRYRGLVTPSFILQAAMLWFGVTPEDVIVVPGSHIEIGKDIRVPIDDEGTMAVDFTLPVVRFSLGELILSAEQYQNGHKAIAPVAALKNAFTLLARTDSAARTIPLANGRLGSRGELTAAAMATIQNGSFAVRSGPTVDVLILLEALILGWFCSRMGKMGVLFLCLGLCALYLLVALGVFASWQIALPLLLPVGLLGFITLFRQLD